MNSKNEKAEGCACEARMENTIDELVKDGTKPTKAQHDKKETELKDAFNNDKK